MLVSARDIIFMVQDVAFIYFKGLLSNPLMQSELYFKASNPQAKVFLFDYITQKTSVLKRKLLQRNRKNQTNQSLFPLMRAY